MNNIPLIFISFLGQNRNYLSKNYPARLPFFLRQLNTYLDLIYKIQIEID